jgi:hypothetical protein
MHSAIRPHYFLDRNWSYTFFGERRPRREAASGEAEFELERSSQAGWGFSTFHPSEPGRSPGQGHSEPGSLGGKWGKQAFSPRYNKQFFSA